MPEWRPGVLGGLLREIDTAGNANFRRGGLLIAAATEAKAKDELSKSSHPYGTPSPARKGGPPSLVTGTGRRSIGHESIPGAEMLIKIGTHTGVFPPAEASRVGSRSRRKANSSGHKTTASSKYLMYQEKLGRFNHPFLKPSFESVIREKSVAIWLKAFHAWPRI